MVTIRTGLTGEVITNSSAGCANASQSVFVFVFACKQTCSLVLTPKPEMKGEMSG